MTKSTSHTKFFQRWICLPCWTGILCFTNTSWHNDASERHYMCFHRTTVTQSAEGNSHSLLSDAK